MTLRYRILLALILSAFVSFGHTATTAEAEPDSQPEPTANNSDTAPTQFRNIYKARAYGFGITVTHSLERTEGNQFKLRFFADSMLASIEETSLFTWPEANGLLIPQEYRYQRKGLGRNREEQVTNLTGLLDGGGLPDGLTLTLPKVTTVERHGRLLAFRMDNEHVVGVDLGERDAHRGHAGISGARRQSRRPSPPGTARSSRQRLRARRTSPQPYPCRPR